MRSQHRVKVRWLAGIAVVLGLFAMHGLTATTASAAAHCGALPSHAATGHHEASAAASHDHATHDVAPLGLAKQSVTTMGVDLSGLEAGHAGVLCVAILIAGLILAALMRAERNPVRVGIRSRDAVRPSRGVRAPPDRAELSVWRN